MLGKVVIAAVLLLFSLAISYLSVSHLGAPYVWVAATWTLTLVCAYVLFPGVRKLWAGLVVLTAIIGGAESYYWILETWIVDQVRGEGAHKWMNDEILGYVPNKGMNLRATKFTRREVLYDITISVGDNGLRISPPGAKAAKGDRRCVLFFGGAYTFGRAVADEETMPYRVGVRSGGKYRTHNFGFDPHGAHQMLAQFEHRLVDKAIDCAPREVKSVIYQAIPEDVRSAAGIRDRIDLHHGPQYALQADGRVAYRGQIGEDHTIKEKLWRRLSKSYLLRRLAGGGGVYMRGLKPDDLKLYLAIVDGARSKIMESYPESEFHVLVWGNDIYDKDLAGRMAAGLSERGISVHRINDVLPGADRVKPEYFVMREIDPMPSAVAHDRVAQYVVSKILH